VIVVSSFEDLFAARRQLTGPVGFVPTMGYLHAGHLSLVKRSRQENASTVVSIFVNPTQFGPNEDLSSYPRDLVSDLSLLEQAGVDLVWTPTPEMMYPPGYQTWVDVEHVTQPLEGARRQGHFRGVTTVVTKLFNAVNPDRAYFGQKDAQQAAVIRQMVRDLNYSLEIIVCPIVREADGLAMSSRNAYLNPAERKAAVVLSQSLAEAASAYNRGVRNAGALRRVMETILQAQPLATVQYVSAAHPDTLEELEGTIEDVLLSMAVYIGKTRLIDNYLCRDGVWQTGERVNQSVVES
jgi:pantoate--beta-alanine ligase